MFVKRSSPVPVRVFKGFTKQHLPSSRNEQGEFVFTRAFPFFGDTGRPAQGRLDSLVGSVLDQLERTEGMMFERLDTASSRTGRRFSGDINKYQFMPRRRYSSVCSDAVGADGGTLARELESYTFPLEAGYVRVFDLAEPNPISDERAGELAVYLADLEFLPSPIKAAFFERFDIKSKAASIVMKYPYDVQDVEIERTLDMRYPDARRWLCDSFCHGMADYLEYSGPPLNKDFDFYQFWPSLFWASSGGTALDDTIARYLQDHEVQALIYPSARTDARVVFDGGRMIAFGGWNLVDYREQNAPKPIQPKLVWITPWEPRLPGGRRFLVAPKGNRYDGSFHVQRCEYHHRALFHFLLFFKSFDWIRAGRARGETRSVNRYVWHRSTLTLEDGVALYCQRCEDLVRWTSDKTGIDGLYDAPDACPSCEFSADII
jgi:hypothetical protein